MAGRIDKWCIICGAAPGKACKVISGDPERGEKPGDVRGEPHVYRNSDAKPAVLVPDEPPFKRKPGVSVTLRLRLTDHIAVELLEDLRTVLAALDEAQQERDEALETAEYHQRQAAQQFEIVKRLRQERDDARRAEVDLVRRQADTLAEALEPFADPFNWQHMTPAIQRAQGALASYRGQREERG